MAAPELEFELTPRRSPTGSAEDKAEFVMAAPELALMASLESSLSLLPTRVALVKWRAARLVYLRQP